MKSICKLDGIEQTLIKLATKRAQIQTQINYSLNNILNIIAFKTI
jgi:hypothetical protein